MAPLEAFVMYTLIFTALTALSVTYSKLTNRAWLLVHWVMGTLGGLALFVPGMDNGVSQGFYMLALIVLAVTVHLTYSLDDRAWRVGYSIGTALCIASIAYALYLQIHHGANTSWLLVVFLAVSFLGFNYKRPSVVEGYEDFLKMVGAKPTPRAS